MLNFGVKPILYKYNYILKTKCMKQIHYYLYFRLVMNLGFIIVLNFSFKQLKKKKM